MLRNVITRVTSFWPSPARLAKVHSYHDTKLSLVRSNGLSTQSYQCFT